LEFIDVGFPLMHKADFVQRTVVNNYSLLYTVTGSDNGDNLPYMLAAHIDVVPAHPEAWEVPPFSGRIINDTYIYGRGAIDNKSGVLVN
jgi:acetylornithine deacetylase/succinyl-diaminopimelate desuccinylase-like protein